MWKGQLKNILKMALKHYLSSLKSAILCKSLSLFNFSGDIMQTQDYGLIRQQESILATNRVLRNTYLLLGLTLLFSALTAGLAMVSNAAPLNPFITIILYMGLLFGTFKLQNSGWGLLMVFALTGFLGYTLGPILNMYIQNFANGSQLIMTALGATGIIFFGLSAYALTTRKDFSYLGGFLFAAIMVAFLLGLGAMVFNISGLSLVISGAFVLLSAGLILFHTSQIIHGGETNYIVATVSIYVALYNLFLNLLALLSAFSGRNN